MSDADDLEEYNPVEVDWRASSASFKAENAKVSQVSETPEQKAQREEEERIKAEVWEEVQRMRQKSTTARRPQTRPAAAGKPGSPQAAASQPLTDKQLEARRKREEEQAKFKALREQQRKAVAPSSFDEPLDDIVVTGVTDQGSSSLLARPLEDLLEPASPPKPLPEPIRSIPSTTAAAPAAAASPPSTSAFDNKGGKGGGEEDWKMLYEELETQYQKLQDVVGDYDTEMTDLGNSLEEITQTNSKLEAQAAALTAEQQAASEREQASSAAHKTELQAAQAQHERALSQLAESLAAQHSSALQGELAALQQAHEKELQQLRDSLAAANAAAAAPARVTEPQSGSSSSSADGKVLQLKCARLVAENTALSATNKALEQANVELTRICDELLVTFG